ncbi:MAG: hypothetical protein ROR55_02900 [Devosia sp.]
MTHELFLRVGHCECGSQHERVDDRHFRIFGIRPELAERLNTARETVLAIEAEEGCSLDHGDRAETMCFDYQDGAAVLPYDQCIRWEFMIYTLRELTHIDEVFGGGRVDLK